MGSLSVQPNQPKPTALCSRIVKSIKVFIGTERKPLAVEHDLSKVQSSFMKVYQFSRFGVLSLSYANGFYHMNFRGDDGNFQTFVSAKEICLCLKIIDDRFRCHTFGGKS